MSPINFRADAVQTRAEYFHGVTRRQQALDVALAIAVALVGQHEVWVGVSGAHIHGPKPAVSAAYLLTAFALALRKRAPLAVAVFVSGVFAITSLAFGSSEGIGAYAPVSIAIFSVAAHEGRRRPLLPHSPPPGCSAPTSGRGACTLPSCATVPTPPSASARSSSGRQSPPSGRGSPASSTTSSRTV